jgi:signal transduction histidine kinase
MEPEINGGRQGQKYRKDLITCPILLEENKLCVTVCQQFPRQDQRMKSRILDPLQRGTHSAMMLISVVVVISVSAASFYIYISDKAAILSQVNARQLLHAQHLANDIEGLIRIHTGWLESVASVAFDHPRRMAPPAEDIRIFTRQMEKSNIRRFFFLDENGVVVYDAKLDKVIRKIGRSPWLDWARADENMGRVRLSVDPPLPDALKEEGETSGFFLMVPLVRPLSTLGPPGLRERFIGAFGLELDLRGFIAGQMDYLEPENQSRQVWVLEGGGGLLFQSTHHEMEHRNIFRQDPTCGDCHGSLLYAERVLKEKKGTLEFHGKLFSRRLAAYAPLDLGSGPAVIVVSSDYDRVTAPARKSLRENLILTCLVAFSLLLGAIVVLRNNRSKVKAEDEARRWQDITVERRRAGEAVERERNRLRNILDAMNDGVLIVDQEEDIQYTNPVMEREFGPVGDKKCHQYFHDNASTAGPAKTGDSPPGKAIEGELRSERTGKIYDVFDTQIPIEGGFSGTLKVLHDISARKAVEDELRDSEERLRRASFQIMSVQEAERRRVSRELHDALGGALSVLKLRLGRIERNEAKDPGWLKEECKDIQQYINQIIEDANRLARDLSPSILEDHGLSAALHGLTGRFAKGHNMALECDFDGVDLLLPKESQIIIYRMIQEALANVGKHSQATRGLVSAYRAGGNIVFRVEDNGKGFDVVREKMKRTGEPGMGLSTMEERAKMLGGTFDIHSEERRGTSVTIYVPLRSDGAEPK